MDWMAASATVSRSAIAYPTTVDKTIDDPVLTTNCASWEPVKATILPVNEVKYEGSSYDRGQFYMYPTVFESLRYIMKEPVKSVQYNEDSETENAVSADKAFGLEIRKVSELMQSSGILDTMYTSVVFMLGYKFPPRDTANNNFDTFKEKCKKLPRACIIVPKGIHFWTEEDSYNKRNAPPEVLC